MLFTRSTMCTVRHRPSCLTQETGRPDPSVTVAQRAAQRQPRHLGSFLVGPQVIDAQQRLGKVVLVAVSGAPESPRAGTSGFAYCTPLGEPAPEQLELAKAVL